MSFVDIPVPLLDSLTDHAPTRGNDFRSGCFLLFSGAVLGATPAGPGGMGMDARASRMTRFVGD
jgi:hypothetical protein